MTQEEILDYNKRCAEFLGWIKTHPKIKDWHIYITPIGHVSYDKMLFHSDWNWIMEVVEAIEKLEFRFEVAFNEIDLYCIKGEERRYSYSINIFDFENYGKDKHLNKKEAVVQAINQFLIWYEQNKTK